jgi:hypothetical protein
VDEDENIEDDEEAEDFLTPALLAIQSEEPLANITSILTACGLVEPELVTSKESSSSSMPSKHPPEYPSMFPSSLPSLVPSQVPSVAPSGVPSEQPSLRSSPAPSRRKNQAQCYQSSQDQSRRSSHRNTHRCFRLHCPHWFEDGVCFDQYYREMQNSTFLEQSFSPEMNVTFSLLQTTFVACEGCPSKEPLCANSEETRFLEL